jgi:hypothetical protein
MGLNLSGFRPGTSSDKRRLSSAFRTARAGISSDDNSDTTVVVNPDGSAFVECRTVTYLGYSSPNERRRMPSPNLIVCPKGRPDLSDLAKKWLIALGEKPATVGVPHLQGMGISVAQLYRAFTNGEKGSNKRRVILVSTAYGMYIACTYCNGHHGRNKFDRDKRRFGNAPRTNGVAECTVCKNITIPGDERERFGLKLPEHLTPESILAIHKAWAQGMITILELGFRLKDEIVAEMDAADDPQVKADREACALQVQEPLDGLFDEAYKAASTAYYDVGFRIPKDGGEPYHAGDRYESFRQVPFFTEEIVAFWEGFFLDLQAEYPSSFEFCAGGAKQRGEERRQGDIESGARVSLVGNDAGRNTVELAVQTASNINVQPDVEDGLSVEERGEMVIITGPADEVSEAVVEYLSKGYTIKAAGNGSVTLAKV